MTSVPLSTSSHLRQGPTHVTDTGRCPTPCLNPTEVVRLGQLFLCCSRSDVSPSSQVCLVLFPVLWLSRAAVCAATKLSVRCSQDPSNLRTAPLFCPWPARRTGHNRASQEHRHVISGYAYILDGGAVSWASKKQELITLSITEAEYVTATHTAKEGIWLRWLVEEVFCPLTHPTPLYSDSQSAITLTKDRSYHARTKHIDIRYHFICFVVDNHSLRLVYCPTDSMVADTLTKALSSVKAKHFAASLGLHSIWGGVLDCTNAVD